MQPKLGQGQGRKELIQRAKSSRQDDESIRQVAHAGFAAFQIGHDHLFEAAVKSQGRGIQVGRDHTDDVPAAPPGIPGPAAPIRPVLPPPKTRRIFSSASRLPSSFAEWLYSGFRWSAEPQKTQRDFSVVIAGPSIVYWVDPFLNQTRGRIQDDIRTRPFEFTPGSKTTQHTGGLGTGGTPGFDIHHRIADHQAVVRADTHAAGRPQDRIGKRLGMPAGLAGGDGVETGGQVELVQEGLCPRRLRALTIESGKRPSNPVEQVLNTRYDPEDCLRFSAQAMPVRPSQTG